MKYHIKLQNKATLQQLLSRRRTTLEAFVEYHKINNYDELCNICHSMSVTPPNSDDCKFFSKSKEKTAEVVAKEAMILPTIDVVVKTKKKKRIEREEQEQVDNNDGNLPQTIE